MFDSKAKILPFLMLYFKGMLSFELLISAELTPSFQRANFKNGVNFLNAKFSGGEVDFKNSQFNGQDTNFQNVVFSGGANFQYVKFYSLSKRFQNTLFSEWANFRYAEFSNRQTIFKEAKFRSLADFHNAQFIGDINFEKAKFKNKADFEFSGSNVEIDAFQGEVDFSGTEFLDEVSFNNRNFRQETSFKNCTFHKAPRFHDCRLHQETDFTDSRFLDTASPGSAMAYRTLKQDMEEKRARQEQLTFYALEMKSRRSAERRKFLKFFSLLYEATSNYGQRIFLPLAWLGYLFVLFTFFYAAYFKGLSDMDVASILPQSLHFSIKQIIRPFGVFSSSSPSGFWGKISPSSLLTLPLIIAATLQSLLSLVLLLLSALAARWRFKIG